LTKFSVHRATLGEIDALWEILSEYYAAAKVVARDSQNELEKDYFGEGVGIWLATGESRIVGCVALRRFAAIQNAGEVKRLYVRPTDRGQGIASALYGALEKYSVDFGYRYLYLDTTEEMKAAQNFYQALGYENCPRYNDNPQATIFMRKELRSFDKQIPPK